MSEFVHGLELSRLFFEQAVRPILRETLPNVVYAAGLIGSGSVGVPRFRTGDLTAQARRVERQPPV